MTRRRVYTWATDGASVLHFNTLLPYSALDSDKYDCQWGGYPGEHEWWREYDVVIGQRLAGDQPVWDRICADPGTLAVYQIDDDLTNVDPENVGVYALYAPITEGTKRNIAQADVVIVPTEAFAARMRQWNGDVRVLPICIPDEMLDWPRVPGRGNPTVGWSGSMFKGQDWQATDLAGSLWAYGQSNWDAQYHFIGADYTNGLLGHRAYYDGWTDIISSYRLLDFDIGLAPLMDSPFNALKSRTKLVEYGARGIPTIASPVGEYVDWIEDGANGILAQHPNDWTWALNRLSDPVTRRVLADAAKQKASEATIGRNIHLWEDLLT